MWVSRHNGIVNVSGKLKICVGANVRYYVIVNYLRILCKKLHIDLVTYWYSTYYGDFSFLDVIKISV